MLLYSISQVPQVLYMSILYSMLVCLCKEGREAKRGERTIYGGTLASH